MTVADLLLRATIAAYVTGVAAALVTSRPIGRFLGAAGAALGSGAALALGGAILAGARAPQLIVSSFAFTPLIFRPDALGAFFLVTVGIVGVAAGVYGFGYSGGLHGGSVKAMGAGINVLLLTLALQVMADNPLTFLFVWEAMSLAAWLLILAEPDQRGAVPAANWYLGVMHVGFVALVAMWYGSSTTPDSR